MADGELTEMRCRACGVLMGVRRRTGAFIYWCSEECAETVTARFDKDQIRDEVAVELHLSGVPVGEIGRFTNSLYQSIQQLLYRRNVNPARPKTWERKAEPA